MKYYSSSNIDKKNATYNVIFGERSNGKTYALLLKAIKNYVKCKKQFAYVRRWKEDVTGRRASQLFAGHIENDEISKATGGEFTGIHYISGKFYLCTYDDNKKAVYGDTDIIGFAFALSDVEHNKSTSYPNIDNIIFDEFLTNRLYLQDEFVLFMNTVSTIVRRRTDVKIYMLGNTVNKFCPYFKEMGLNNIPNMKQGSIEVYAYGDSTLTVAVEYCKASQPSKAEAHKYFAFDNPKLSMITGGSWELAMYPHLMTKYKPKDILLTYFIDFNDNLYQCEIINVGDSLFTYIHEKTTELQNTNTDLVFSLEYSDRPNYNRNIFNPTRKVFKKIASFYFNDRVFYQNNSVGDAISNYLKICKRS